MVKDAQTISVIGWKLTSGQPLLSTLPCSMSKLYINLPSCLNVAVVLNKKRFDNFLGGSTFK